MSLLGSAGDGVAETTWSWRYVVMTVLLSLAGDGVAESYDEGVEPCWQ
jgi:hypothetical protein